MAAVPAAMRRRGAVKRARVNLPEQLIFIDELEVWVLRKSVKNIRLEVKPPDGRIEVHAPLAVTDRFIEDFVREKHGWIVAQQERIGSSRMARAAEASPDEVALWKQTLREFAPPLIKKWERVLGVKAGTIAYRNMKSRWGSCQPSTGRICLNTRLALYPPECLEYVVVHELCHLRVSGHTPQFWALVEACLPDYKRAKKKLGE